MSALPPMRTFAARFGMSAKFQKRMAVIHSVIMELPHWRRIISIVGGDMFSLRKSLLVLIAVHGIAVSLPGHALAQEKSIVVASTTSTKDTGLFDHLLPLFTMKTGIAVNVLAVGTGQALDIGRRGDADVVFVHNKSAEQTFVVEGHGVKRYPVMYNDFVLNLFFFASSPASHQIAYEWDLGPSRRVGTTLSSVLRGRRVLDIPAPASIGSRRAVLGRRLAGMRDVSFDTSLKSF
jgi:periplasmic binding family protein